MAKHLIRSQEICGFESHLPHTFARRFMFLLDGAIGTIQLYHKIHSLSNLKINLTKFQICVRIYHHTAGLRNISILSDQLFRLVIEVYNQATCTHWAMAIVIAQCVEMVFFQYQLFSINIRSCSVLPLNDIKPSFESTPQVTRIALPVANPILQRRLPTRLI